MEGEEVARVLGSFTEVDYTATKLCEHLERKVRGCGAIKVLLMNAMSPAANNPLVI